MFRDLYLAGAVLAGEVTPDLTNLVQYGVLGLVVMALVTGVLAPKWVVTKMEKEADMWRSAYEKERESHGVTRDANTELARTSSAAVETAKTATALLEKLEHPRAQRGART